MNAWSASALFLSISASVYGSFPILPLYAQDALGFTIVLDPGHGGSDTGVQMGAISEKTVDLEVAKRTEQLLSGRSDISVFLTRRDDYGLSLDERRRLANSHRPGIFVSLHMAGAPDPVVRGARIYALSSVSVLREDLVMPLMSAHQAYTQESWRWVSALTDQFLEDNPETTMQISALPLAPLLGITMPAAMVELGYLTSTEGNRWENPATWDRAATMLVAAIDRFRSPGNNPSP
ncbi:MAG TPA: N-acetylmuramoyl-L-alanine amidase [Bdellovibrionota bacterium]|nr:N-acetylmuramoyl-L-alanine amidase [Bdellovibrionota bacterium]